MFSNESGAKVEREVSRARPPHSRPRPPAFSRDATPPPPPLRPRGLGHRRRPSCLHRPAPHTAAAAFSPTQSRCRLGRRHLLRRSLISLEHLPATGHGETETPAAPAGNSPATARGDQAVRAPAAFPPLSSGTDATPHSLECSLLWHKGENEEKARQGQLRWGKGRQPCHHPHREELRGPLVESEVSRTPGWGTGRATSG